MMKRTTTRIFSKLSMLDLTRIRDQFPALNRPVVFFDNPGGTQIARHSLARIHDYLVDCNANHGGAFATSQASDAIIDQARSAAADFLNAASPDEIVLGPNMTSLTFRLGRAIAPLLNPGETVVVTRLDHDANVTPWLRLAHDRGLHARIVDFDPETGLLDLNDYQAALEEKPRLVAVGYASNALGTVNPLNKLVRWAKEAGALTYIDAVQYAPHGPIDVQQTGCDFLVCSAYKFFGPHVGVLYGRYDLLESIPAYRVRPAPALPPGKFETGTNNFEGIAGLLGALEYLEWLGNEYGGEHAELLAEEYSGRRLIFKQAMAAIRSYETELSHALLDMANTVPGLRLYGPDDARHLEQRVPTFSFTLAGLPAAEVAARLAQDGFNVWDGNFYAVQVTERLGVEQHGGLVRVGAVHYNTIDEVSRLGDSLRQIANHPGG
jgi:cysteine desulfurase family protein (TIGR01976 family)